MKPQSEPRLDSCRNVRISISSVNAPNDDAIVLQGRHALVLDDGTPRIVHVRHRKDAYRG